MSIISGVWKIVLTLSVIAAASAGFDGARAANELKLSSPEGGEIRALVIGIDEYQHVRQLRGATADAHDIESSLRSMGVRDVTALINAQAERSSVLQEISAMVERTRSNDVVLLSIAGHGTQEPERIKGSQPDGMEDVFLLPGFEPTPAGSQQRILGSEFNHFIRQFELRGARVIFVADTCHGGGMVRDIDPRAAEMSFRQVPGYTLLVDELKPVSAQDDPRSEFDLDHTAFLAAVDRYTKAPEVHVPGVEGLRGALSYAVARAIEGNADADHDGKVTLKELFANIRQVVYQLSDQRQNVVTTSSPSRSPDTEVAFAFTRGIALTQGVGQGTGQATAQASQPPMLRPAAPEKFTNNVLSAILPRVKEQKAAPASAPIRLAALDGKADYFRTLKARDTTLQAVQPTDNPDLIWDPSSHDVIAWGDVVAYGVELGDLPAVIERTTSMRALKGMATQSPQVLRVSPDDRVHHRSQVVEIELSEVKGRAVVLFNVSGDGTVQLLYPKGSDAPSAVSPSMRISLRVGEPFGAEQIIAVTSQQRMVDLEDILLQFNRRRASGQIVKSLAQYAPADARIGSVGFFTGP